MSKKIDWVWVWEKFDKWVDNPPKCKNCGSMHFRPWEAQMKKIQRLVKESNNGTR